MKWIIGFFYVFFLFKKQNTKDLQMRVRNDLCGKIAKVQKGENKMIFLKQSTKRIMKQ